MKRHLPVVLERIDGHAEWLNTQALRAAGITRDTPDPVGGRIERNTAGDPSGVLVDNAMNLVEKFVPPAGDAERRTAMQSALAHMNSVGLTAVGDAGVDVRGIALYRALDGEGALTVRIYAMIRDVGEDFAALSKSGPLIGEGDSRLTVRDRKSGGWGIRG